MITRVAVYIALGLVLAVLGIQWDQAEFWCLLGLFWCVDFLSRNEGRQEGVAMILSMPMMQVARLKTLMEMVESGKIVTVKELMDELENKNDK